MAPFQEDRAMLQNRLKVGLQVLRDQAEVNAGKVAATGYCFGGLCVLDRADGEDFQGAASFHGLFNKPGNTDGNAIKAKVLALHGWDDPMVPPADVVALAEELTASGADWQIHGYGNTLHAHEPGGQRAGYGRHVPGGCRPSVLAGDGELPGRSSRLTELLVGREFPAAAFAWRRVD